MVVMNSLTPYNYAGNRTANWWQPIAAKTAAANVSPIAPAQDTLNYTRTGSGDLAGLYNALMGQTGPTSTVQTSQLTRQNESPALMSTANSFIAKLNELSKGFQGAYQGKQNTYQDLINALTNTYGTREAGAIGAAQSGALASGLTPLEAQGAGQGASLDVLAQYFPALAGLRTDQSQVGIDLQNAYKGLQTDLNLPFIQNVLSPYYQAVAGQQTQGTQATTDTLGRTGLLANLAQAMQNESLNMQNQNLEAQKLAQQAAQFQQTMGLSYNQLNAQQQSAKDSLAAQLYSTLTGRDWQTGERVGAQGYATGEREATQQFSAQQQKTATESYLKQLGLEGKLVGDMTGMESWDSIMNKYWGGAQGEAKAGPEGNPAYAPSGKSGSTDVAPIKA
jgi:hypothetical protein